jgi:hypothetical protein
MVKYLILIFSLIFFGCEINGRQIIQPEKFNFDNINFNSVSKKLVYENIEENSDTNNMKKIIEYWYDNKIKTNGFEGTLDIVIKEMKISKLNKSDYFKFTIDMTIEFIEKGTNLERSKTFSINISEYGEINGKFSINDQENLSINIMHKGLYNISKKLSQIN